MHFHLLRVSGHGENTAACGKIPRRCGPPSWTWEEGRKRNLPRGNFITPLRAWTARPKVRPPSRSSVSEFRCRSSGVGVRCRSSVSEFGVGVRCRSSGVGVRSASLERRGQPSPRAEPRLTGMVPLGGSSSCRRRSSLSWNGVSAPSVQPRSRQTCAAKLSRRCTRVVPATGSCTRSGREHSARAPKIARKCTQQTNAVWGTGVGSSWPRSSSSLCVASAVQPSNRQVSP